MLLLYCYYEPFITFSFGFDIIFLGEIGRKWTDSKKGQGLSVCVLVLIAAFFAFSLRKLVVNGAGNIKNRVATSHVVGCYLFVEVTKSSDATAKFIG